MSLSANHRAVLLVFCFFVLLCSLSGCGAVLSRLGEAAVDPAAPTAVRESLQELTEEENLHLLNELLALEGVEAAGEHLGRGLMRGFFTYASTLIEAGYIDGMGQERLNAFVERIAHQIDQDLTPVLVDLVAAVTHAFIEALAEGIRGELGVALRVLLVEELGPAIEQVIRTNLGPAFRDMLSEEFNQALGETARVIAHGAALGTFEGLQATENAVPGEAAPSTWLESIGDSIVTLSESMGWIFWGVVILLAALILVLLGWATRLVFQARAIKRESDPPERHA